MKKCHSLGIVALFALIFIYGCQPSGNKDVTVKADTVFMRQMQFQPAELTVNIGDTVVWINDGIVVHNVTAYPDSDWTSDSMRVGNSWKKVVTDSFSYFCSLHPTMKGEVIIREAK